MVRSCEGEEWEEAQVVTVSLLPWHTLLRKGFHWKNKDSKRVKAFKASKKDGDRLFSTAWSNRTRGDGLN